MGKLVTLCKVDHYWIPHNSFHSFHQMGTWGINMYVWTFITTLAIQCSLRHHALSVALKIACYLCLQSKWKRSWQKYNIFCECIVFKWRVYVHYHHSAVIYIVTIYTIYRNRSMYKLSDTCMYTKKAHFNCMHICCTINRSLIRYGHHRVFSYC